MSDHTKRAALAARGAQSVSLALAKADFQSLTGLSHIYGFNFQPSWGHDASTIWLERFDPVKYRQELTAGCSHFPGMNAVRIWLGFGAFKANPELLLRNFRQAVEICSDEDLLIIPVLFSVWSGTPPFDPVKLEDLLGANFSAAYSAFLKGVLAPQRGNSSILAWDICNEPQGASLVRNGDLLAAQTRWLQFVHDTVKSTDPDARTCCGTVFDLGWGEVGELFSDITTPHIYGYPAWKAAVDRKATSQNYRDWFDAIVCQYVEQRLIVRKDAPLLVTETVWGSACDATREAIIRDTLSVLKKYKIGFIAHALSTSGVSDLHLPPEGASGQYEGLDWPDPRSMAFVNADGELRPGHAAFNEFAC